MDIPGLLSQQSRQNKLADLLRGFTGLLDTARPQVQNKLAGLLNNYQSFDQSLAESADKVVRQPLEGLLSRTFPNVPDASSRFDTPETEQAMNMAMSLMPMGIVRGGNMAAALNPKYGNSVDAYLMEPKSGPAVLSKVVVNPEARGQGIGSQFMNDLTTLADQQGKTLALSPSADFGGNKARLIEFYKRFGFVPNKGRNMDYSISESMRREPNK